jgi:hypothetical protein
LYVCKNANRFLKISFRFDKKENRNFEIKNLLQGKSSYFGGISNDLKEKASVLKNNIIF